jgi:glutaminyl-peptide cyclotransferase
VLLGAHYDTKTGIEGFVGANDSGSGTGLLLELARALAESPAGVEVRVAFFDGEEAAVAYGPADGFHGSRRLAAEMEERGETGRLAAMILLDMVGDRNLGITLPSNGSPELARLAFESARELGVREKFRLARFAIGDDHVAFAEKGVPTLDLIDFEYGGGPGRNEYWHTAEDTLDKMSPESLATVGRVVLRMVEKLGAAAGD